MTSNGPLTWLITGANQGLGLAVAKHALSRGDKVIAAARDISKIPPSIASAEPLKLDVSGPHEQIVAAAKFALEKNGRIDVLVNNAGWCLPGPVEELDLQSIQSQFQTNVFGQISLIQALLPSFREQKSGFILNFSSLAGFAGRAGFGAYNASKSALEAFTEALSGEVTKWNIRAIIIEPGIFPTNALNTAIKNNVPGSNITGHYTDASQGYQGAERYMDLHLETGQVGDPVLFAERVYDIVHGTGPGRGLFHSDKLWTRVPIGVDCGRGIRAKLQLVSQNIEATEPIWSSTDMSQEKVEELRKQLQA